MLLKSANDESQMSSLQSRQILESPVPNTGLSPAQKLPRLITKAASKQSYYTICFLADRPRVDDAYRAYAYFRWLDDCIDEQCPNRNERIDFVERQQALMNTCFQGISPQATCSEERMLIDLIQSDPLEDSGLQSYIRNMMQVIAFDSLRMGQLISEQELAQYSHHLAIAVTEALHYFIGHEEHPRHLPNRYLAVTAAHIAHMLRDTFEDTASGYFNIPCEFLQSYSIDVSEIGSPAYRIWVKSRVELARSYFAAGRNYLKDIDNLRFRITARAYIARFEWMLDTIEKEAYFLRPAYPERKSFGSGLKMGLSIMLDCLKFETWAREKIKAAWN